MNQNNNVLLNFGSKEVIVSDESEDSAKKDVESLEIQAKFKKKIITGHIEIRKDDLTVEDKRPERDFGIYCAANSGAFRSLIPIYSGH
jgi:hypothetical protein